MLRKILIDDRGDGTARLDKIDDFQLASERPKQVDTFGGAVQC